MPDVQINLSDLGNAQLLAAIYGNELRYVPAWGAWAEWVGTHWRRHLHSDETAAMKRSMRLGDLLRQQAPALRARIQASKDADEHKALTDSLQRLVLWSQRSESRGVIIAARELLRHIEPMQSRIEEFDLDPLLLACPNGTVDLRTGTLRKPRREDWCSHLAAAEFDPECPTPRWTAFMEEVLPDIEVREWVQRAMGYSLTGMTTEQVWMFAYGDGANGKSVLLDTFMEMLGDYAIQTSSETFILNRDRNKPTNDIAALAGRRFVQAQETDNEQSLAEGVVKQVTGSRRISARFLFGEWFEFVPQFKLWLPGQHRPRIGGNDTGAWRRVRVIPFDVTIPYEQQDRNLSEKLRAEWPGILAWCVEGCLRWQANGLGAPDPVMAAVNEYRDSQDLAGPWIKEFCQFAPSYSGFTADLYAAYRAWADASNTPCLSMIRWIERIIREGGVERYKSAGMSRLRGVALRRKTPAIEEPTDAHDKEVDR